MAASKIEWTDRSDWNPIRGCTRVSPGCGGPGPHGGCYAEGIAARFSGPGQPFEGFAKMVAGKPRWTGKVELLPHRLLEPLSWRKPAKVFACSMSDLFHEALPDSAIDQVFAVMALCPHLTFQVLTKRAARMREYMSTPDRKRTIAATVMEISEALARAGRPRIKLDHFSACFAGAGPFPNVWLGVSVEDQKRAAERIPDLLATPAAVRFLSAEPLLGPLNIASLYVGREVIKPLAGVTWYPTPADWPVQGLTARHSRKLHWVIAGGESARHARPSHPDWFRSLRDQCQAAGVPYFFKQWGEWLPSYQPGAGEHAARERRYLNRTGQECHGAPANVVVHRIGKKAAGALLDGREWREMPR